MRKSGSNLYRVPGSGADMELVTEEYLRSTSSIAHKIGQDLDAAREAYAELWQTLTRQQQRQLLDEAIIDPAAVLKYARAAALNSANDNGNNVQDIGLTNRNKFSWFTRSQLNLFTDESLRRPKTPARRAESTAAAEQPQPQPPTESKTRENNNLLNKIKNKVTNMKIPSTTEEKQSLMETSRGVVKAAPSKPKTPPPPPPPKAGGEKKALLSVDVESDHDDIPKTGFDFLDNW